MNGTQPPLQQYDQSLQLGANWRLQFIQPDGVFLNMLSFEVIDFGATSYKEIFQNVKTILATALWSAPLERTLGVDDTIVDLPQNMAEFATIAILNAITQWEPRVIVMEILFKPDMLSGHLTCFITLQVNNVIYGAPSQAVQAAIAQIAPSPLTAPLAGITVGAPGAPGAPGQAGVRGSLWFQGAGDPAIVAGVLPNDMYLNTANGDVWQFDTGTLKWRRT